LPMRLDSEGGKVYVHLRFVIIRSVVSSQAVQLAGYPEPVYPFQRPP
jgi:hypothetical protein